MLPVVKYFQENQDYEVLPYVSSYFASRQFDIL